MADLGYPPFMESPWNHRAASNCFRIASRSRARSALLGPVPNWPWRCPTGLGDPKDLDLGELHFVKIWWYVLICDDDAMSERDTGWNWWFLEILSDIFSLHVCSLTTTSRLSLPRKCNHRIQKITGVEKLWLPASGKHWEDRPSSKTIEIIH